MCGIIGYIGKKDRAINVIIDGLERLEYRGYDSAGIAYYNNGKLDVVKEKGKIANLKEKLDLSVKSNLGIGHTRWATHGVPNNTNSHPHSQGVMTIVHNGIIENYDSLREELINKGYKFKSETDTEVAAALLDSIYKDSKNIEHTIAVFREKAKGAYAIGMICNDYPDKLFAIKKYSPLIIGLGEDENYIASDVPAILKYTKKYMTLDDGDAAIITSDKIIVLDDNNEISNKSIKEFEGDLRDATKNGYSHYMLKEIMEEPTLIKKLFEKYIGDDISKLDLLTKYDYKNIDIVACGSAYHAGAIGKSLIEEYANVPVNIEIASEYRYKKLFIDKDTLVIVISQSGETADTLAAVKIAKEKGAKVLGVINVVESTIARNVDTVIYTNAGPEIAVATTKGYTTQVGVLALIALSVGLKKGIITKKDINEFNKDLTRLPSDMLNILDRDYKDLADKLYIHDKFFFIGRGMDYYLSMEGALKLKEISYINANSYAAGELKHGTISLIDEGTPVVAIVTDKDLAEKTINNIKEVKARGAYTIVLTTKDLDTYGNFYDEKIVIPSMNKLLISILAILPLQMLSFEIAKLRGCDIDKPKNLAKSVTVE